MRPADRGARRGDFLLAERRAVRFVGVHLRRRALGDQRLAADEARPAVLELRRLDCGVDRLDVVPVDVRHDVPPVRLEALRGVVGEPVPDVAVDRDAVVVVEDDQLAQAERPGQRADLVRDPLHEAAVADERVGVVVDDLEARAVELLREQALGERHADRVREPLPERAGGRLDAGRDAVLRVSRRHRAELAEALQLRERQVVAGQVEQRVEQHRPVPVREHEPVAVGPLRVRRVVTEVPAPERDRDLGHAHRHAGMSGVCRLHRIHRERADGVRHLALGAGIGFGLWRRRCASAGVRAGGAGEAAIIIGAEWSNRWFSCRGGADGESRFHRTRCDGVPDGRAPRKSGARGDGLQPHACESGRLGCEARRPFRRNAGAGRRGRGARVFLRRRRPRPARGHARARRLVRDDGEGRDPRRPHHRLGRHRAGARGRSRRSAALPFSMRRCRAGSPAPRTARSR